MGSVFRLNTNFEVVRSIELNIFHLHTIFTDMSIAGTLIDIGGKIEDKTVEVVVLVWIWIEIGDMNGEVREQVQIRVGG